MTADSVTATRSLAVRLRRALGLMAVFMSLASLGLLFMAHRGAEEARALYTERVLPLIRVEQVAEAFAVRMTVVLREVRSGRTPPAEGQARLRRARELGDRAWVEPPGGDAAAAEVARRLASLRDRSFELEKMLALGMSGELGTYGDSQWLPEVAAFMEALEPLRVLQRAAADAAIRDLEAQSRRFTWVGAGLLVLALVSAWSSAHVLARRLTEGAEGLMNRLEGMAGGDLEPRPLPPGSDEWALAGRSLESLAARMKALLAAQEAEQALQNALLDGAQAAVISLDAQGIVNRFNRQAEVLLGYRAEEVVGKATPLLWRVAEELEALAVPLREHLQRPELTGLEALQIFTEGEGTVSECTYRHRDGSLIPVALGRSRVQTPDGRVLGTMGVAMDLRPLKSLESELRASEIKYRQLVARIPGVVVQLRVSPEGTLSIPFAGAGFQQLLGSSPEVLVADPEAFLGRMPEEDRALFLHLASEARRTASPFQWDGRLGLETGGVRWVRCRATAEVLPDGDTLWDALLEDQTELLQAERALAHSEERWQLALEANRDGIWDLDPVAGQVWYSPRWKEILGFADEELPNLPGSFEERIHPDDVGEVRERLRTFLQGGTETYTATFRMRHRDGSWRWILSRGSAVRDMKGQVIRAVGSHADITEQRQVEQTLRESEARAQAASRAKSSFLANMSHELRTPLSAILGYARLLAREEHHSTEERAQLHHILEAGEHLLALINDVLSLSKIEAGRLELKAAAFAPGNLFALLEGLFNLSMQAKGLRFRVEASGFPAQVLADEPKLRQVLVNLLGNALKFTEVGEVSLIARWSVGRAWFTVRDTGPGIAPEDQAQIFQAFSQTERGAAAGGTGLGLHLSQALVRLMGGEIQMLSTVGEGSRFTFELPLPEVEAKGEARPEPGLVTGLVDPALAPLVLVVDDRLENRDILNRLLTRVGLRVRLAEDGAQALARWAIDRPDLVLMDLRMPNMDGFGATQAIRGQEAAKGLPRTPVLAISASVYDVSLEELKIHGFDEFLVKPIEEPKLFAALERFLGIHFTRRAAAGAPVLDPQDLNRLPDVPREWRQAFRAQVVVGDLESAAALLETLADRPLAAALRERLKAYQVQELLAVLD
jgi:PAS domain S-box-containing protein